MRYRRALATTPTKNISFGPLRTSVRLDTREELINGLQEAIQIEHGLMLQYLFAAVSCKRHVREGVTEEEAEVIRQWEAGILSVARDEMAHLATACNLVTAIGGSPDFNRPNFPQEAHRWFPFGFQLERLGTESLNRFVRAESPKPTLLALSARDIAPDPIEFDYVGELYGLISNGFRTLVPDDPITKQPDSQTEATLFIGRPDAQDASDWSANLTIPSITNRRAAEAAITFIVEQGEGNSAGQTGSHFDTFSTIAREHEQRTSARPGFTPSRNVMKNPLTRRHRDAGIGFNLIESSTLAHPTAELFNHVYASALLLLMQFFDPAGETPDQRQVLQDTARRVMSGLIRPLAEVLTTLPATTDPQGPTAGPPFELYGVLKLPAHPRARFIILSERFAAAASETHRLWKTGGPSVARLEFLHRNCVLVRETLVAAQAS